MTVKRIHREGEKARLRPENRDYEELVLKAGDARVQRRGV